MRAIVLSLCLLPGLAMAEDFTVQKRGNTTYITTVGNLAPDRDPGCISLAEADGRLSPPDLTLGVIHCLKQNRVADAADLMVLMLARSDFDTYRVTDKTAYDAGRVLTLELSQSILLEDRTALRVALAVVQNPGSPEFAGLCQRLRASGVPGHDPGYMISHGMGAFSGTQDAPLVNGFDAAVTWDTVLKDFMHCSA